MAPVFESIHGDAAGRLGELSIPRADTTVETPALLPVINPHLDTIAPSDLDSFGAQMLITNAYIFYGSDDYRDAVLSDGLNTVLEFDGAIMTDSGSYQLAEYGEIDVNTPDILRFQQEIGADIATPVDIPTHPTADREQAKADLETTLERLETAVAFDQGEMLLTAPVQGGTYTDLRERAGREARATGLDVFPIGGVVPLLREYRFGELVDIVKAAKAGLGPAVPVHLFGAGHPMMFALAAALGCDLFDSAAYALYARDGRYMTVRGTEHLSELQTFPCSCPVCVEYEPDELQTSSNNVTEQLLAEHNLHVSFGEIRRIRQAIREGTLLELIETRAHSHPAMLDGYRALLEHGDWLEEQHPVGKGSFFYLSSESADRPAVHRHHARLARLDPPDSILFVPDQIFKTEIETDYDAVWTLVPPFGPIPPALTYTTPLNAETPSRVDDAALKAAVAGINAFLSAHPAVEVAAMVDHWPDHLLDELPQSVTLQSPE